MPPQTTTPSIPRPYSADVLEQNLDLLERVDPGLAARLRLPVDGSRVEFEEDGAAFYRLHRTRVPLDVTPADLERSVAEVAGAARVAVLGIGLGELVHAVLAASSTEHVVAWERDPWLLRLCLMRRDFRADLESGRLRFALCSDLLDFDPAGYGLLRHPFLGKIYHREMKHVDRPRGEKRAVLCAGGLFVDQLADALEARGFDLWTIELRRLAREELDLTMERFQPRLVASINYIEGLPQFCRAHDARLLCWEVDPCLTLPKPPESPTDDVFVFTHRRGNVGDYRQAGFAHVEYMPLAADPVLRTNGDVPQAAREYPVSFVGASMVETARDLSKCFTKEWVRWRGGDPAAADEASRVLSEILAGQRERQTELVLPELLEDRAPGFIAFALDEPERADPVLFAAETAASEKRLGYVANLGALGACVWGDGAWRIVERHGVRYMGSAAHGEQLTGVYNSSRVNVDVGRIYQNDIVTMRVFDVLSCGAFMLAEHNVALEETFDVGTEVVSYRTVKELMAKARYYVEHPREAREIAMRGRAAVHARHTIARRLDHMLSVMGESGPRSVDA